MMGPLEGVRVADLTQMLAGPYCTMLLADLGADVMKVEPPSGDFVRQIGPFPVDDSHHFYGGYFQSVNRGKRSIVLDLKTDAGREEFLRLVKTVDVVVENFSPGVMERLGVPYETLREINPALVYGATRGFGDRRTGESPYADWPALDVVVQAVGGLMSVTGTEDGRPLKVGVGVGDIFPATLLALGIVSAVLRAGATGEGQFVDVAMYDGVLALCERLVYQFSYTGEVPRPVGNRHPILSPFDVVRAKNGDVIIAGPSEPRWARLCTIMGRTDLIGAPGFESNDARAVNQDEVRALLTEWVSQKTVAEVVALLGGEVPVAPVNDIAEIFRDGHVHARRMLETVEHPGSSQPVAIAGTPIKFTDTETHIRGRAPLLDEHGDEIRAELDRVDATGVRHYHRFSP
jgi:crotonobetainyl-CoA:carnitine CoA-transferase CaiB-like acyl-CoA transferase